jgi:hypothetical protein
MSGPPELERLSRPLARLLRVPEQHLPDCLIASGEADLPGVLQMRRAVIGDALAWDDRAYLAWRYVLDGARWDEPRSRRPGRRLWLFKRGEEVLGCLGAEQVELATPRGVEPAVRFMDLAVVPRVNGMGIGAWMNLMLLRDIDIGISVGGSDQSIGMIGRLFRRMPDRRLWSLPLRSGPVLASRWPWFGRAGIAGRAVDLALAARRGLARAANRLPVELSRATAPDPSIADLVGAMVASGLTMVRRDENAWRWRFQENPRRAYELHLAHRQGKLAAALVVRHREDMTDLVDWLWDPGEPERITTRLLVTLFTDAIEVALRRGAIRVRAMTYDALSERVCRRLGMLRRPGRFAYSIRSRSPQREEELARAPWFVTFGDSDGD